MGLSSVLSATTSAAHESMSLPRGALSADLKRLQVEGIPRNMKEEILLVSHKSNCLEPEGC